MVRILRKQLFMYVLLGTVEACAKMVTNSKIHCNCSDANSALGTVVCITYIFLFFFLMQLKPRSVC